VHDVGNPERGQSVPAEAAWHGSTPERHVTKREASEDASIAVLAPPTRFDEVCALPMRTNTRTCLFQYRRDLLNAEVLFPTSIWVDPPNMSRPSHQ
jgi:hypothetical protein